MTGGRDANGDGRGLMLEQAELCRLMLSTSKLVKGLKEANQHVQSLSHGIMPVQIDTEGLQSALTNLAKVATVEDKVTCHFVCRDFFVVVSNTVATHLFRIAQEAVNNAQRHGKAKEICISLSAEKNRIQLEVSDDGIGIDASAVHASTNVIQRFGLQIMQYRAGVIGGGLSISRGNNIGTVVRCTIPIQRNLG